MKTIKIAPEYKTEIQLNDWTFGNFFKIISLCIIATIAFFYLVEHLVVNNIIIWMLAIGSAIGVLYLAWKQPKRKARLKLLAFLLLTVSAVFFETTYNLEPSLLPIFISKLVHTEVLGIHIPPSAFFALDPLFVVILGLFFSWLWRYLAEHKKDISLPAKFAMAFLILALGVWVLMLSIHLTGYGKIINPLWIVFAFLLFAGCEVIIGPIGMSLVGRLSPPGKDGILMGIRNLYYGFAGVLTGYAANLAVIPRHATLAHTGHIYSSAFFKGGLFIFIVSIILFLLTPYIKRLIASDA